MKADGVPNILSISAGVPDILLVIVPVKFRIPDIAPYSGTLAFF